MPHPRRLPDGEARITRGYRLKACHVIHTVGPIWHGGHAGEDALLASAYRNSFALAQAHSLVSIAFPAISTGVYGFPAERAARIAVDTLVACLCDAPQMKRIVLACFGAASRAHHEAALAARLA